MFDFNSNKKGKIAEKYFRNWLDKNNIPYWYIQQDIKTFSESLKLYFKSKRPDFMILIPNIGFILVDIKNKKFYERYKCFSIDYNEIKAYSNLQRTFNVQIWYAISNNKFKFKKWFWIPISKIIEIEKKEKVSSLSKQKFFPINISNFIEIDFEQSLDYLFSKIFIRNKD